MMRFLPKVEDREVKEKKAEAALEKIRRNSNRFAEFVIKDEKGNSIRNSDIHRVINEHIDLCREKKLNCGILAPWRHGKTEQVVIGRTLQFLGENPNNRIFIVCNTDDNAASRVASISKYIEKDKYYHYLYPNVMPAEKAQWSRHKLIINRSSYSKDCSVEAWGITTSGTGAGCDFLIGDDPVDLRNAILNPALRIQVKDAWKNVWSSRLTPNGFKIYIATAWHNDDLTSELRKNPEWCFLVIKVSEDFNGFECESPLKGKFKIPLWDLWPRERLMARFREIGSRAFNRGYRQDAISDEDRTFPSYLKIFKYGVSQSELIRPEWPRVCGMDPFGKFVVIFTLALGPNGKRYPVEIRRGKWNPSESVMQLIDAYQTHHHQIIVVENNASQEAIVQWAREKGHTDIPIIPFTTGTNKSNIEIGLPSMEVEFENDAWTVAMSKEHEPDCSCGFCVWKKELGA
ncbi:MAG: hypothetical protein PHG69_05715, partial [Candidatus Omnitrophica bacterium]|nr:hypothetical protein [Candidatus Omnitrophota bacterium]